MWLFEALSHGLGGSGANQMEKGHEEPKYQRSLLQDDLRSGPVHEPNEPMGVAL